MCLIQFCPQNIRLFTSVITFKIALFSTTEHLKNTIECVGCCILQLYVYDHMVAGVGWVSRISKRLHLCFKTSAFFSRTKSMLSSSEHEESCTIQLSTETLPSWCWSCSTPEPLPSRHHTLHFTLAAKHARWKAENTCWRLCVSNILQPHAVQIYL